MGNFSTFSVATSGLMAAQAGLNVIGHNISNVDTVGYSRQQVLQNEFFQKNIGYTATGLMQVGLGTDISAIRQSRDIFLDMSYRNESSKFSYYNVKQTTGEEIESIVGELQSEYRTQAVIQDLWDSINEIVSNPESIEPRENFISTAQTFLDKVNNIYDRLTSYQYNLNEQVKSDVIKINQLTEEIQKYNKLIASNELSGDHANDYRDARNTALDELSKIIKIEYRENKDGFVNVTAEGNELISNGQINKIGLRYTSDNYSLVEPVFTVSSSILPYDKTGKNAKRLYNLTGEISSPNQNDRGHLKGLLVSRGMMPVTSQTNPNISDPDYEEKLFNINECTIPKVMRQLDTMVNSIVKLINNSVSPVIQSGGSFIADPNAPYGIDSNKTQNVEVFVRNTVNRFDAAGNLIPEDSNNPYTHYSIGNIKINPEFTQLKNYDKLAFSESKDVGDANVALKILKNWNEKTISYTGKSESMNIEEFYGFFVNNVGVETKEAKSYCSEQEDLINQVDNNRKKISGVSLDEELKNMMIYQHAYDANARVINTITAMIDKLINGTGRVGL